MRFRILEDFRGFRRISEDFGGFRRISEDFFIYDLKILVILNII